MADLTVKQWLAEQYGWRVFDVRVTDLGYAYSAYNDPDPYAPADSVMNFGHRPVIIVKRTGAVWQLDTSPNFHPLFAARDERSFYAALAAVMPYRDPRTPDDVLPAGITLVDVVFTRAELTVWLSKQFGWQVFDGRIHDLGYAYAVSTHPDAYHAGDQSAMTYGNGPLIAVKSTGSVWAFGSSPVELPVLEARDEASFYAALAAISPGRSYQADYTVSRWTPTSWQNADRTQPVPVEQPDPGPALTEAELTDWLRDRYGWAVFDGRIRDVGFAFLVNQQPDAYHLGDYAAAEPGVGPLLVIRRTGAVWTFGSDQRLQPLYGAEDEAMFDRMLGDLLPDEDPAQPRDVVPIR